MNIRNRTHRELRYVCDKWHKIVQHTNSIKTFIFKTVYRYEMCNSTCKKAHNAMYITRWNTNANRQCKTILTCPNSIKSCISSLKVASVKYVIQHSHRFRQLSYYKGRVHRQYENQWWIKGHGYPEANFYVVSPCFTLLLFSFTPPLPRFFPPLKLRTPCFTLLLFLSYSPLTFFASARITYPL